MELIKQLDNIIESTPFNLGHDFLSGKTLVAYGAGRLGEMVAKICTQHGISISFFVDKNCYEIKSILDIPVCSLEYLTKIDTDNTVVLISAFKFPFYHIKSIINQFTDADIFTVYDLLYLIEEAYFSNGWFSGSISIEDKVNLYKVFENLDDIRSKETYLDFINWRVSRNEFDNIESSIISENEKYNNEITQSCLSKLGSIVDVGSFDLSFSLKSLDLYPSISKSYAFEPDKSSYAYCLKKLEENHTHIGKIKLEPLAISEVTGMVCFAHQHGLASRLVHKESNQLEKVDVTNLTEYFNKNKIDDTLIAIKIHNEGDELQTLKGARSLIEQHRPLLMVNCSHRDKYEKLYSL